MSRDIHKPRVEPIQIDQLACWRVHTAHGEALIAHQGAQLLSYQPHGQQPIVWLSETAEYKTGQGLRGGVPVCWPWFGRLDFNPAPVQAAYRGEQAPAHGLVRTLDWQLDKVTESAEQTCLHLSFDASAGLPNWPHSARLELVMTFGERLTLALTTHNVGDQPLPISQALHTYFAVSDCRNVVIDGLQGARCIDTLKDWQESPEQDVVRFTGEVDRIYLDVDNTLVIRDPHWQRDIHVHASNSRSAVVWNPWIDKTQRLSQMTADAWQGMLCVETARVLDDLLIVPAGGSDTMSVSIWSELAR